MIFPMHTHTRTMDPQMASHNILLGCRQIWRQYLGKEHDDHLITAIR